MKSNRLWSVALRLSMVMALLAITTLLALPTTVDAGSNGQSKAGAKKIIPGQVAPPTVPSRPQQPINRPLPSATNGKGNLKGGTLTQGLDGLTLTPNSLTADGTFNANALAAAGTRATDPRDMKLLLIHTDNSPAYPDYSYLGMKAFLDRIGVPYDTLNAINTTLTDSLLYDGTKSFYQGVILSTGSLVYYNAATNNYPSAFDDSEWLTLWNYEAMFGLRQVTAYTLPGWPDNYGLLDPNYDYVNTSVTPVQANLTAAANPLFSYLNTNSPITLKSAWTYLATVAPAGAGETITPLLTTSYNGTAYTVAAIKQYADGRQNLAVTFDNNSFILHSQLLSYGIINWVTQGKFLGDRRVVMDVQPDDLFIDDDIWSTTAMTDTVGITYRLSGTDFNSFATWQTSARGKYPLASNLEIEWPFNSEGTTGIYPNDTLTPVVLANPTRFNWINHTYSHANLDTIDAPTTTTEIQKNNQFAQKNKLSTYYKDSMIQPDISGLYNQVYQQTAYSLGIRYIISDASLPQWAAPSPNAGFYSSLQPGLLIIPRRASNLFYNLYTPDQWVSEYNCYYGPKSDPHNICPDLPYSTRWDHNLTYQEILDKESDNWLSYLVTWELSPIMFHQPNTASYNGTNSLLGDLIEATLTKYSAVYNLPIKNLSQHDIGIKMANRMAYNASGVKATLYPATKTIVMTTTNTATVPLTGVKSGSNYETYGGQTISQVPVTAGLTTTITYK